MKAVGVIVEYNPFHNGHLYHLNKVKELYPTHCIIAIMSGNFMQRGQISLISKWDKTKMALNYGVDLVLDLPFVFANESADYFAQHTLKILNHFQVETIVFGSESNDKALYLELANLQLYDENYNNLVKEQLDQGFNYPTACSNALELMLNRTVRLPNDILGLSYTKAILKHNYKIEIEPILRTNDFHSTNISEISSATSIRNAITKNDDYKIAVPSYSYDVLNNAEIMTNDDLFSFLQYKIVTSSIEDLSNIHLVNEGIEYKLKKEILLCNNFDDIVRTISSKRYTYSRISRMLINVLVGYTKSENIQISNEEYYRVLGVSNKGLVYLRYLNESNIEYDTNIKNIENTITDVEYRCANIIKIINKQYKESITILKKSQ